MENELLALPNLGHTSVNWLRAIGVQTRADLERIGPVEAFVKVRSRGMRPSRVFLYSLQAALLGCHWTELDPDLKRDLIEQAERLGA
ncbi:MAG: TfoX/Sxy family protein [Spongiibacteraceae bacterium]|jgi:DNA transformation protein|nr:TfoX/Sxy family protein [Spongiibacteraceae bacterium]